MSLMNEAKAPGRNQQWLILGVVAVAVVAFVIILAVSMNTNVASGLDFFGLPQQRLEDGGFVIGNPEAKVTIVEFADYACSHCIDYKPIVDRFIEEYVVTGKAKYELRVFPTAGGQMTVFTGTIAACLDEQKPGAFWAAGEKFYQKAVSGQYDQNVARTVTQELGLDYSAALKCSESNNMIVTNVQLGQGIGVRGTPAVAVRFNGGTPQLSGESYEQLVAAVAAGG